MDIVTVQQASLPKAFISLNLTPLNLVQPCIPPKETCRELWPKINKIPICIIFV